MKKISFIVLTGLVFFASGCNLSFKDWFFSSDSLYSQAIIPENGQLTTSWQLHQYAENQSNTNSRCNLPQMVGMKLEFEKNGKVVIDHLGTTMQGKWNFDRTTKTLTLQLDSNCNCPTSKEAFELAKKLAKSWYITQLSSTEMQLAEAEEKNCKKILSKSKGSKPASQVSFRKLSKGV